jgi:hypothetical protein
MAGLRNGILMLFAAHYRRPQQESVERAMWNFCFRKHMKQILKFVGGLLLVGPMPLFGLAVFQGGVPSEFAPVVFVLGSVYLVLLLTSTILTLRGVYHLYILKPTPNETQKGFSSKSSQSADAAGEV